MPRRDDDILLRFILPALAANNLTNTTVLVYDHNWERRLPRDRFFGCDLLASPQVAGIAWRRLRRHTGREHSAAAAHPAREII